MSVSLKSLNRAEGTIKQRLFVKNLLDIRNPKTFANGTESAKRAGYKGNRVTLASVAYENLRKPQTQFLLRKSVKKVLSSEEVLQKLSKIANTDLEEVKSSDVVKTLELLAKHHKLLTDRVESEVTHKSSISEIENILSKTLDSEPEPANEQVN